MCQPPTKEGAPRKLYVVIDAEYDEVPNIVYTLLSNNLRRFVVSDDLSKFGPHTFNKNKSSTPPSSSSAIDCFSAEEASEALEASGSGNESSASVVSGASATVETVIGKPLQGFGEDKIATTTSGVPIRKKAIRLSQDELSLLPEHEQFASNYDDGYLDTSLIKRKRPFRNNSTDVPPPHRACGGDGSGNSDGDEAASSANRTAGTPGATSTTKKRKKSSYEQVPCHVCGALIAVKGKDWHGKSAHAIIHSNITRYGCPMCDFRNRHRAEICRHVERVHSIAANTVSIPESFSAEQKMELDKLVQLCFPGTKWGENGVGGSAAAGGGIRTSIGQKASSTSGETTPKDGATTEPRKSHESADSAAGSAIDDDEEEECKPTTTTQLLDMIKESIE